MMLQLQQTVVLPMPLLRLDALRRASVTTEPFQFTVIRDFLAPTDAAAVRADFPEIPYPGLLPVEAMQSGPLFRTLIDELKSEAFSQTLSEKFDLDLVGRPMMLTVRGRCAARDGRIHTDSETKLASALLYLNDPWEAFGGRLRLLRGPDDLNDMVAEVSPDAGTLVAFRRSDRSFHGHEPYVGVRRYVMINWMTSGPAARREILRHHISARTKRLFSTATRHA
jgi:hypothetical protein